MEQNIEALARAMAELQEARKRARSRKIRERLDRALALISEVHHNLTT